MQVNSDNTSRAGRQAQGQFIQLRLAPALQKREQEILDAFSKLPAEFRTPSAAVLELMRKGLDVPHSTLSQILRRLERRGAIHLDRKR